MAKILVIEDESLVSQTIELLLLKAGHAVVTAADGARGLAVYEAERPDVVISDIMMPEKEGIQTIRELRSLAPRLPIIAISGGGRTRNFDYLEMALKLGADEALRKPFAHTDLLASIARLCAREAA